VGLRIQVVLARIVDDPHVPLFGGRVIGQDSIDLSHFEILAVSVLDAQSESRFFAGFCHGSTTTRAILEVPLSVGN